VTSFFRTRCRCFRFSAHKTTNKTEPKTVTPMDHKGVNYTPGDILETPRKTVFFSFDITALLISAKHIYLDFTVKSLKWQKLSLSKIWKSAEYRFYSFRCARANDATFLLPVRNLMKLETFVFDFHSVIISVVLEVTVCCLGHVKNKIDWLIDWLKRQ